MVLFLSQYPEPYCGTSFKVPLKYNIDEGKECILQTQLNEFLIEFTVSMKT